MRCECLTVAYCTCKADACQLVPHHASALNETTLIRRPWLWYHENDVVRDELYIMVCCAFWKADIHVNLKARTQSLSFPLCSLEGCITY